VKHIYGKNIFNIFEGNNFFLLVGWDPW